MGRYELLMAKLAEEAGEVVQRAIKCQQFGLDDEYENVSARDRLHEELNDLYAVVNILNSEFDLGFDPDEGWTMVKKAKIDKWANYAAHVETPTLEEITKSHTDFLRDCGIYGDEDEYPILDESDSWWNLEDSQENFNNRG